MEEEIDLNFATSNSVDNKKANKNDLHFIASC